MAAGCAAVALSAISAVVVPAAPGYARRTVSYEIVSDSIHVVDVEYVDDGGRRLLPGVALPWRFEATLADPRGGTGVGAQLRADWRRTRGPARWVTVRIYDGPNLLCQSTLDVGNVSCYGNTPHVS